MYETYEEWIDIFMEECNGLGYYKPVLKETFEADYEAQKCPYEVAADFVKEMSE